ncbi:hypothetical protein L7F22_059976 [Adiantum nelumboides]|nr:hypothetical protein [Adiantum nelumboides]
METTITHAQYVPPGFRFHPTDEELINFYLKKKVASAVFTLDHVIREVDLNKLEPWDLHEKCKVDASHQTEWYFFSHKDKKYPTGTRTNRATAAGFWKATGRDKAVHAGCQRIGMRKTLVFYRGRAPHGKKTDWIMHEYRLEDKDDDSKTNEDGWVVCRVFKKRSLLEKDTDNSNANLSDDEVPDPITKCIKHDKRAGSKATSTPRSLTCKEELDESASPCQPPFLHLPQLESPKMPISADNKRTFAENCKKTAEQRPSSSSSESGPFNDIEGCSGKNFFMSEENLAELIYNGGPFTENWSVYDNIARYHLDFFNFPGDFSQSLTLTRSQQPLEYPSNCEVDLWNFTR